MTFYTKYCFKCEKSFPEELDNICYLYSKGKWSNRFICLECILKKNNKVNICSLCNSKNSQV